MTRIIVVAAATVLALTACSSGSPSKDAGRTVELTLKNLAFQPSTLAVAKGETVTFRMTNEDTVMHDAFIGDAAAQAQHEQLMRAGGGHQHGDVAVDVYPNRPETLTFTFAEPGTIELACHVEGHYAAGMRATITVT